MARPYVHAFLAFVFGILLAGSVHAQNPRQRLVTFHNGAVALQGALILPSGTGRFPAVVFLHGSGPGTREGARAYAEAFAEMGIVSLIFDKRGSGASGGKWTESSLDDLTNDALAALQFARAQPEVQSDKVGFWGVSQAAWVATSAAARSADVSFLMLISGGGATPQESERFSYDVAFSEVGLTPDEKKQGQEILDAYFGYLGTGKGRAQLLALLQAANQSRLKPLTEELRQILPSDEGRRHWSWVATYDPRPLMEKIKVPTLLMFGDKDHPSDISVERWREGLRKAGNSDFEIVVFPGAGHGIRMRDGYKGPGRPPFADGYEEVMMGWLWLHVVKPPSKP